MIEKKLKKEGIHGEPYKLLFGNIKEMSKMSRDAKKQALLNHDIVPWASPFLLHLSNTYKKIFVMWAGPTPRITVTDPKLIKEVVNRYNEFHKCESNAFIDMFVTGLASYNGEKWDHHRKILNPAFHVEKLKRMYPRFCECCDEMINRWEELVSKRGSCELDVADEFQNVGGDVISRTAFGSNIEEGRSIFQLQKEQCELILASPFTLFFPSLSECTIDFDWPSALATPQHIRFQVGILVAVFCVRVWYTIWWWPKMIEKKLKKEGIHGEPYQVLFGNLKEMIKMSRHAKKQPLLDHDIIPWINPFLVRLSKTYKKIFVLWAGPTPRVTVTDPKLIREVLNRFNEFHKPEANAFIHLFVTGLASYDGEKWDTHRKILNPAFHVEKLKRMFPAISVCCDEMINRWEELVSKKGSCELDVLDEFLNLGGDVISRAAFGSNIEEGRSIFLLQKEQCELILASPFTLFFPSLRFIPTATNRKAKYIHKKVISLIRGIIEKREDAVRRGESDNDDILGLLLKARDEQIKSKTGRGSLSTEDVIEECKEFYFAGQDTTTALLSWTLVVLSMHPEWQDKARKEVFQVIGKNKPKFDDLNQLKIANMIFQEVMRLYPAIFLIRSTSKDTKLGDMTIPAGVQVCVPTHLVHRNPEVWGEDALMFNPERFSEGVSKAVKEQMYFPFGWGARMCIGMNFGMLEAKLILAQILQHFWFELSPSYTHAPLLTLIMRPQYGAQIILHKL